MNNINLHGRHPKDLPDKETINDILLELKDTNKFDINWIVLNNDWLGNAKVFNQWLEKGEIVICEMDPTFPTFNISQNWSDNNVNPTPTAISIKETRYDIFRHPTRISVKLKNSILSLNKGAKEIIDTSNDVYLRLKDYLGPDLIQDQFTNVSFDIDFMISSLKIIR